MNPNERIAQLEETIRLKDQKIYDVKTSVAGVLEEIHELNEKNEDEVLRRQIAELCTDTRYELLIDEIDGFYQKEKTQIIKLPITDQSHR